MSKVWTPALIKAELTHKGYTLVQIELELGLYKGAGRQGIRGGCFKAAERISQILGVPFRELFPQDYLTARPAPGTKTGHRRTDSSHNDARESMQKNSTAADSARAA